jgi:hypothetical protein
MADADPERRFAARGQWDVEFARSAAGRYEAEEFLDGLHETLGEEIARKAKAKFVWLFTQMATRGRITKANRFSRESGKVYGFKYNVSNHLLRIACIQDGKTWVLTHGFDKPGAQKGKGAWPPEEITRATRLMEEHQTQFGTKGGV